MLYFRQVFSSLPDSLSPQLFREYESKIDEVCWLICKKNYLKRENALLSDECVYQLFRVFCLLGDLVSDSKSPDSYQVSTFHYCTILLYCFNKEFQVTMTAYSEHVIVIPPEATSDLTWNQAIFSITYLS